MATQKRARTMAEDGLDVDEGGGFDEEEAQALRDRETRRRQEALKAVEDTTAAAQADKPVFLSRAQREAMTRDEEQEKEEITQLMDEAEKEQRHAYMQKVRESIQESRNKRPASTVKRHPGCARVRHPRPSDRSWRLRAARHSLAGATGPTGAQPLPRGLEPAASQLPPKPNPYPTPRARPRPLPSEAAEFSPFGPTGQPEREVPKTKEEVGANPNPNPNPNACP